MFVYKIIITKRNSLDKLNYKIYCNYMKKNSILMLSITIIAAITGLLLLIFCIPNFVPMHIGFGETIDALGSKWLLLISIAAMLAFAILSVSLKNKGAKIFFCAIAMIFVFCNLLALTYYSLETEFVIGMTFKIPLSILVFMPLSFLIIVWANILKHLPYKSKLGLKIKHDKETEFLWTQIHYAAKDNFFAAGIILLFISLVFAFFKIIWLELIIFVLAIILAHIKTCADAKSMWQKYSQMQERKENLEKIKVEKNKG